MYFNQSSGLCPLSHDPRVFRMSFQSPSVVFGCSPFRFDEIVHHFLFCLFCPPAFLQTHTMLLSNHTSPPPLQPPRGYCWECVRTTINTRGPSRSEWASAPGTSTGGNSFAASLSATRRSTTGCWTLQRRPGIPSSRVRRTHWW